MEKNSDQFSMEYLRQLANSETAQNLMAMLSRDPGAQKAAASAQSGDMESAKQALSSFLSDPKAQALLRQLQEKHHE